MRSTFAAPCSRFLRSSPPRRSTACPRTSWLRAGVEVPVKPATIFIHNFALTGLEGDAASFEMTISAGGYVRSVAHELGQLAGCGAHLASLRRTRAGAFSLAEAITVDQLKAVAGDEAAILALLPHPRAMLIEMPSVTVDDQAAGRLRNGMQVNLPEFSNAPLIKVFTSPTDLLGIAKRIAGTLTQPIVVLT